MDQFIIFIKIKIESVYFLQLQKILKIKGTYFQYISKRMQKNSPMVPPLDHFQGKNRNCSSLARIISASRRSFFVNLTTFERRSGLKKFSLLKITILKISKS